MIPGSFRIRSTYSVLDRHLGLRDRHEGCRVVLDLERSKLIPVPDELRLHVASALEIDAPDEVLMAWMTKVGLVTSASKPRAERAAPEPAIGTSSDAPAAARLTDYGVHAEWHFDRLEDGSMAELESLFERNEILGRHGLVIGADRAVDDAELLLRFLALVEEEGADFEGLGVHATVASRTVTQRVADALEGLQAKVTVRWDGSPAIDPEAEAKRVADALARLRPALPQEPQVDTVLGPDDRLLDFWRRARALGARRVEGIQVEHEIMDSIHHLGAVNGFANDLAIVADEMLADVSEGKFDFLYQPVARVVGYLIQQERTSGLRRAHTACREAELSSCSTCWVKEFCSRNRSLIDPAGSGRRFSPNEDRCDFWRAEVHASMLLFDRLREVDPEHFLHFPVEISSVPETAAPFAAFDVDLDFDLPS